MNTQSGRKIDVLIEPYLEEDEKTGLKRPNSIYNFMVWADKNKWKFIKSVEGVVRTVETEYGYVCVAIDKRYDQDVVAKEIEAAILCAE